MNLYARRALSCLLAVGAMAFVAGCGGGNEVAEEEVTVITPVSTDVSEEKRLYDMSVAGAKQATRTITVLDEARKLSVRLKEAVVGEDESVRAVKRVLSVVEGSIDLLKPCAEDPAPYEEFSVRFARMDERRLACIDKAFRANRSLTEVRGGLEERMSSSTAGAQASFHELNQLLKEAIEGTALTVEAFGGTTTPTVIPTPEN
ncbi:MAG: hypothetical protein ACK4P3_01840 [Fimbriimonadaceae bacterium]